MFRRKIKAKESVFHHHSHITELKNLCEWLNGTAVKPNLPHSVDEIVQQVLKDLFERNYICDDDTKVALQILSNLVFVSSRDDFDVEDKQVFLASLSNVRKKIDKMQKRGYIDTLCPSAKVTYLSLSLLEPVQLNIIVDCCFERINNEGDESPYFDAIIGVGDDCLHAISQGEEGGKLIGESVLKTIVLQICSLGLMHNGYEGNDVLCKLLLKTLRASTQWDDNCKTSIFEFLIKYGKGNPSKFRHLFDEIIIPDDVVQVEPGLSLISGLLSSVFVDLSVRESGGDSGASIPRWVAALHARTKRYKVYIGIIAGVVTGVAALYNNKYKPEILISTETWGAINTAEGNSDNMMNWMPEDEVQNIQLNIKGFSSVLELKLYIASIGRNGKIIHEYDISEVDKIEGMNVYILPMQDVVSYFKNDECIALRFRSEIFLAEHQLLLPLNRVALTEIQ